MDAPIAKRQKTRLSPEPRASMAAPSESPANQKSVTSQISRKGKMALKGRRRFMADLNEVASACENGWEMQGLRLKALKPGEEEGSIFCTVIRAVDNEHIVSLNLTVPDTSEYPSNHYFICFAEDDDVPSDVLSVIETVTDQGSRTIGDMVKKLLTLLAKNMASSTRQAEASNGEDAEESEDEDVDMYYDNESFADDEEISLSLNTPCSIQTQFLTRDFVEIVAAGYHPGLIRIGIHELALSVSVPGFSLADIISPRALMAWDPRILDTNRHFTLLITGIRGQYPVLEPSGHVKQQAAENASKIHFRFGLSKRYKPSHEQVVELTRSATHVAPKRTVEDAVPESPPFNGDDEEKYENTDFHAPYRALHLAKASQPEKADFENSHDFIPMSLSTSLEPLLNDRFLDILHYRIRFNVGWAGAEIVDSEVHRLQKNAVAVFQEAAKKIHHADAEETKLLGSYRFPADPLKALDRNGHLNLPLIAFSYLLRRLILCSRFCLVCYERIGMEFEALRPYVCDNKLCTYQYYNLNRGPSLEYEICARPRTVDLLVSLTYVAAAENALEDFPDGMNLVIEKSTSQAGSVDFDSLSTPEKRQVIVRLLAALPPVEDMKHYLEQRGPGLSAPALRDMDPQIPSVAWSILRWCVASCTSHLEELTNEVDRVGNVDSAWIQFRFTVGAPSAEAKFATERKKACAQDANARQYPSLYAFHGSPVRNWHSIIRHGLWYKNMANGRAYGNGVDPELLPHGAARLPHAYRTPAASMPHRCHIPAACLPLH